MTTKSRFLPRTPLHRAMPALLCLALCLGPAVLAAVQGEKPQKALPPVPIRTDAATIADTDPEFWAMVLAHTAPLEAPILQHGAQRLLAEGTFPAARHALGMLRGATLEHPEDAALQALLAQALATPYRWTWKRDEVWLERARDALARAQQLDPADPEVRRAAALLAMLDNRLPDAERSLRLALGDEPDHVETLLLLGGVLRLQDRFRDAYPFYGKVLTLAPEDWRGYSGLADVYRDDEWYEEALVLYRKAARLQPVAFMPRYGEAIVFQRVNFEGLAVLKYRDLLKEFPDSENLILLTAASAHMSDKQYGAALAELEQISFGGKRGLCDGSVLYRMGICKLRLGDFGSAAATFRRVLDEYPDARDGSDYGPLVYFGAAKHLSSAYEKQGLPEEAADVLREASEHPEAPLALQLELSHKLSAYQLHDLAAQALRRGLESEQPDDERYERLRLRVELARALRGIDRQDASAESQARLAEIQAEIAESGSPADCYQLARGHALAGQPEQALEWLRQAVERGYRSFDLMRRDPDLAGLRALPGYQELVRGR